MSTRIRTRRPTAGSSRYCRSVRCGPASAATAVHLLHVPFCEQRCGFCNLFTQPVPERRSGRGLPRRAEPTGRRGAARARRERRVRDRAGGDRRRHADLARRRSARRASIALMRSIGFSQARRRCRSRPRPRPRCPIGSVSWSGWRRPDQHRRAELRRRRVQGGQPAAARRRRPPRAARDPRCGRRDAQHRSDVRPAGPDRGELARLARRGARVSPRGAVPLPAVRAAADHARPRDATRQ